MAQWLAENPAAAGSPDGTSWNTLNWRFPEADLFPGSIADVQGGALRLRPSATTARNAISTLPPTKAQVIYGRLRRTVTAVSSRFAVHISSSGLIQGSTSNEQPTSGYSLIFSQAGTVTFARRLAGTSTTLHTATGLLPGTGYFRFRLERTAADVVRFRAWDDAATEPATWNHEFTDTAPLAAGVPHVSGLGAAPAEWYISELVATSPGLPIRRSPKVYYDMAGERVPFGKLRRSLTDDCMSATPPSWVTGTLTYDAPSFRRILTAPASGSASITLPPIDLSSAGAMRAVWFDLDLMHLNVLTNVQLDLKLVGTTYTYQARITSAQPKIVLTGQGLTYTSSAGMLMDLDLKPHSLSLLMLPRAKQVMVVHNRDQIVGWLDLPDALAESVTPTITLTALSTNARLLRFGQVQLRIEQGVENVATP